MRKHRNGASRGGRPINEDRTTFLGRDRGTPLLFSAPADAFVWTELGLLLVQCSESSTSSIGFRLPFDSKRDHVGISESVQRGNGFLFYKGHDGWGISVW
ncbi:hypothetical protein CDAR_242101 [Caerostris darwini]|uniref:Uncharacterized protein n=1 Tax=Caerostris darwini TaxID=1538125 RepID=A0AAV4NNE6_9ARAC|nr:hypothetical protein CDAR_242101 [Caerostris darwini]